MNLPRVLLAGVVGGVVMNLNDFLMHGVILSSTYERYAVFGTEPANPLWFLVIAIMIGLAGALLFAKTRDSWGAGIKGGATFGVFVGLVAFFPQFYNSLVIKGFPYFLSWCWGGVSLIGWVLFGVVAALLYRPGGTS